jgi:hypothetical protein
MLHTPELDRLEEVQVKPLLHLQLPGFRSNWEQSSNISNLKRMRHKIAKIFKILEKLER